MLLLCSECNNPKISVFLNMVLAIRLKTPLTVAFNQTVVSELAYLSASGILMNSKSH